MHLAKTKIYYSIVAISLGCGPYALEAGFKKALDEKCDLDTIRVMAASKSQALNEKRTNETDPQQLEAIKRKILLSALRIQKVDEIKKLMEAQGLESPLDEHYIMLKTVEVPNEVPSATLQSLKEEVKEVETKTPSTTSHVDVQVEEEKEDWDSLIKTATGRLKLRHEALALIEEEQKPQINPSQKHGGLFSGFETAGGWPAAIGNLKKMIDHEDWDNEYNWPVRGWVKKYNNQLIALMKTKLEGPIKDKYSKKS